MKEIKEDIIKKRDLQYKKGFGDKWGDWHHVAYLQIWPDAKDLAPHVIVNYPWHGKGLSGQACSLLAFHLLLLLVPYSYPERMQSCEQKLVLPFLKEGYQIIALP
ncbi:hypothetical protein ACJX0J_028674 [Zea mays]